MNGIAPSCPISNTNANDLFRNDGLVQGGIYFPGIPAAVDLASLIAAVNALKLALQQFTGNWTVNNLFEAPTPNQRRQGNTYYSPYPEWQLTGIQTMNGFVYHKNTDGSQDKTQRAYVTRINQVTYKNVMQEDPDFNWNYYKKLDG